MEQQLNVAVLFAQYRAVHGRHRGILVTRHGYSDFTVALSPDVPYGSTREQYAEERIDSKQDEQKTV
ncbi:hypothetical protein FCN77_20380 [Arthrobacter sp. 24S4-2]|nr:hypothetical protein FCN77_20380 [Arthrobacter sp. 24S4-2]